MRPPTPAALGLLLLLLLLPPPPGETAKKATPCKRCRELVDKFNQGMVDTAKKNFGGGNTAWEEKALSKYEFSEVRLLEIMESLCGSSDFDCHSMLEEHEERLEAWWLRLKKEYPDLFEWFCVKTLEVCCSPGTYGPDCLACQGGSQRPCSGNGHCSGDGSRQGDGSCQCHPGYQGATCTDCVDGYFSSLRNETHSICTDVDECAAETPPCGDQQYCENVNGSFVCEECDSTCVGCTGKGPEQCKECVPGYTKESGQCADVDECSLAEKVCARESENCYNTPGSYVCVCPEGFEETETACVQTQTAADGEWPGCGARAGTLATGPQLPAQKHTKSGPGRVMAGLPGRQEGDGPRGESQRSRTD
ncbi:protein disulfide isomerase CRELD2 isoform X3 [Lynx rufus]|uniref:protein disulfide isomerase CRELD2 isoform X3 n=1 Tax=Lynx rufus TaxID=61384 RepID=UPI001F126802|nr:protein disulfide isomerase CRELD2 isoform X3 [Lynx rufus]